MNAEIQSLYDEHTLESKPFETTTITMVESVAECVTDDKDLTSTRTVDATEFSEKLSCENGIELPEYNGD